MPPSRRKRHAHRQARKNRGASIRITPHTNPDDEGLAATARLPLPKTPSKPEEPSPETSATATTEESDLTEYVERIEAAAQRAKDKPAAASETTAIATVEAEEPKKRRRRRRKVKPAEPPKPWYKRRRTWFFIASSLPILVGLIAGAYILNLAWVSWDAYKTIHEEPVEKTFYRINAEGTAEPVPEEEAEAMMPDWSSGDPFNILLLGVDTRVNDEDPPRSDTAIVVHINPETKQAAMMSIPRDLLVNIPGHGEDKFNAAYAFGASDDEEGAGPALVAETVMANFGIPIHYYVTVDFEGFKKIVDTVGGVTVDVHSTLSDNLYPTDDLRLTRVYFPTGLQHLDGQQALQYVRTRHADSDLGRSVRQQQVLMEIREQALDRNLITRANDLIQSMADTFRTDLGFNEMLALANLGRQINTGDIARFDLWGEGLLSEHFPESEDDPYYLMADWNALLEMQAQYFETIPPSQQAEATANAIEEAGVDYDLAAPIKIENATDIIGLAGHSAQLLTDAGFTDVTPVDAPAIQEQTVIQDGNSNPAVAKQVAKLLGLPDTAIQPSTDPATVVTVVLGSDVPASLIPTADQSPQSTP